MTQFCSHCGTTISEGARFCPRCGTVVPEPEFTPPAVAPAPVPPVASEVPPTPRPSEPAPPRRSRGGLIAGVLIALVALALIAWALLAGMPFGRKDRLTRVTPPTPEVVSEQQGNSGTVSQIGEPAGTEDRDRIATTHTNQTTGTVVQPPVTAPTPSTEQPPLSLPDPASAAPVASQRAISEDEASNVLRGYVSSANYYQTTPECIGIVPMSYENRGYTIDVVDRCGDRGRLGRWRVDAMTREVFVRKADGRYLRP